MAEIPVDIYEKAKEAQERISKKAHKPSHRGVFFPIQGEPNAQFTTRDGKTYIVKNGTMRRVK